MTQSAIYTMLAALPLVLTAPGASAGDTLEQALDQGADRLDADAIVERFVGHTGTWVSPDGAKKINIYYGEDNGLFARPVGGEGQMTGFYGITDTDRMCISWDGGNDRLRCLDVVEDDRGIVKYNADGSLNGTYEQFSEGRVF